MPTRTTFLLIATLFSLVLVGTVQAATAQACPVSAASGDSAAVDRDMARWQKARALYLHDLQLSTLEQQKTLTKTEQDLADHLADAYLYVSYAEAERLALASPERARNNLDEALRRLDGAYALASAKHKARIDRLRQSLQSTRELTMACNGTSTRQQRKAFEGLRKDIGQLVRQVG